METIKSDSKVLELDGIHMMVPRELMLPEARKKRDTYAITPGLPFIQCEFGFYSLEAWAAQGMPQGVSHQELFGFEPSGGQGLGGLGWCEAAFHPCFEEKLIQDRGDLEVVQDAHGRHVLCFKGRRNGFMPEYLDHPVKDMKTWEENCKWRMEPEAPGRFDYLKVRVPEWRKAAAEGKMIAQRLIGGFMYLRSLIGPSDLLYKFYDEPELIHDCMKSWLKLAQAVTRRHQEHVTYDEIYFAEDICYNNGPLISPDMMREFLFPYYQELINGIKERQLDRKRHLYFQVDTDGWAVPVIQVYQELGMDAMNPFEVASRCDVVEIGRNYPNLVMSGGLDKRILAESKAAIDRMVDRIFPVMRERGGYTPTCDHGVPAEVPYENYLHYRKRALEFAK
jgi:uroporphyrinogen decarboxylase